MHIIRLFCRTKCSELHRGGKPGIKISYHRWSDIVHVVSDLPTARKPWYIFYPTLTLKTEAFVTCWAVKKWGNARPYTKSRKKVRKSVVKIEKKTLLGCLWVFGKGKNRLLFGRLWNAVIKWKWSTAAKVRSYSDNGTLSPLVHCNTDRWTIAYRTQLHDVQCLKTFMIIVSL